MIEGLSDFMTGECCRAELFNERWREPLQTPNMMQLHALLAQFSQLTVNYILKDIH